jgi:hypothetical protein
MQSSECCVLSVSPFVLRLAIHELSSTIQHCFRSTRNQRGNYSPILATVLSNAAFNDVFVFFPFTGTSIHPSMLESRHYAICFTLGFHSTWNQRSNCNPILATVLFVPHPSTLSSSSFHLPASIQPVDAGIKASCHLF